MDVRGDAESEGRCRKHSSHGRLDSLFTKKVTLQLSQNNLFDRTLYIIGEICHSF